MLDQTETVYMLSKDDVSRVLRLVECLNESLWHLLTSRVIRYSRFKEERNLPCPGEQELLRHNDRAHSPATEEN